MSYEEKINAFFAKLNKNDRYLKEGGLDDQKRKREGSKPVVSRLGGLLYRNLLPFHLIGRSIGRSGLTGETSPFSELSKNKGWVARSRELAWDPSHNEKFKQAAFNTHEYLNKIGENGRALLVSQTRFNLILMSCISLLTLYLMSNFVVVTASKDALFWGVMPFISVTLFLSLIFSNSYWKYAIAKTGEYRSHPALSLSLWVLRLLLKKPQIVTEPKI